MWRLAVLVGLLLATALAGCAPDPPAAAPPREMAVQPGSEGQPAAPMPRYGNPQVLGQPIPAQPVFTPSAANSAAIPSAARAPASLEEVDCTQYVPSDSLAVTVFWPRRSLSKPEVAILPIQEMIEQMATSDLSVDLRAPGVFLRASRIRLSQIEMAIHIVDRLRGGAAAGNNRPESGAWLEAEQSAEFFGSVSDAYILRFIGPAPREGAMAMLFQPQEVSLAGKTYYGRGMDNSRTAAFFPDERTLILGEETLVRKMIVYQMLPAPGPVADFLRGLDPEHDISSFINWQRLRAQLPAEVRTTPLYQSLADRLVTAKVLVRLSARPSLRLVLEGANPDAAAHLEGAARRWVEIAGQYGNDAQASAREAERLGTDWERLASRVLSAMRVEQVGKRVEISLIDFLGLGEAFALADLLASGGRPQFASTTEPPPEPNDSGAAAEIRQLIPAAAGIRLADFVVFASSGDAPKPEQFKEHPLTLGLMNCWKYDDEIQAVYRAQFEEFCFLTPGDPDPAQIGQVMAASSWLGYCSMIQPEYITDLTCRTDAQTAQGTVSFQVPGLFQGKVRYAARRIAGAWQITEFQMPARTWKFARDQQGSWHWSDLYGDVTDPRRAPAEFPVMGRVTWRKKPLTSGQIEFFHERFPEWPFAGKSLRAGVNNSGVYSIDLPKGIYFVRIVGAAKEIPEKYSRLDTSGLRAEIKEQDQVVNWNLQ